jgi:hypothetical protein
MEKEKSKSKEIKKHTIANEILIFFKILKFTAPIAIVLFIVLYTVIYKIPYSKHPDLIGVYVERLPYGTRSIMVMVRTGKSGVGMKEYMGRHMALEQI